MHILHTNVALPLSKPINVSIIIPNNTSFTVVWTVPDPNYNYNYTVIVTNLNTNMMTNHTVMGNQEPSYSVAGFDQTENFKVSVATVNVCGENRSDPITVFGKRVHTHITVYMCICLCMYVDSKFIIVLMYTHVYEENYVRKYIIYEHTLCDKSMKLCSYILMYIASI